MEDFETKNALIESTFLGWEDHRIFTCFLYLKYDGGGQGFGGYALDTYDEALKRRKGTAQGAEFIARVLETVGVDSWEKLPGKFVRVVASWTKVKSIGHIIEDKWFSPEEFFNE